jgi:two-component system response regulator AtoC
MARILIVDDEKDVREAMARILERAGHQVDLAGNAPAGIQAFEKEGADLVITDIIMPGQHGVDLIKHLREAGCAAPVIAISGGGNMAAAGYEPGAITTSAYLAAAGKAGAAASLTKPFERRQLLELVDSVLSRGNQSSAS